MNIRFKSMLMACALLGSAFFSASAALAYASSNAALQQEETQVQPTDIKVQINDRLVDFPTAQPYVDGNSKLQVPVRAMADELGYKLLWEKDGPQIKITLKGDNRSLSFATGETQITVNGESQKLASPVKLVNGSVYLPFRVISENLGATTQWDETNRIAILGTDGNYYAPAWYKPANHFGHYTKVIEAKASAYTAAPDENGGFAGLDYMGKTLKLGTIAVDPSVIPLGSKVYIEGYSFDGLPVGGMYGTASDTGGVIKGNKIDIFIPQNREQVKKFGIQNVKVYVLAS